ncbi:MAG: M48 family metallopeptidase [Pseudomonadales bacterium]|nr:M48 family metallopeptidase [Pseudomonadales bacterium]
MTSEIEQQQLWVDAALGANAAEFNVRASRRARRLGMRVSRTGRIEVVTPARTPKSRIEQFIAEHRNWALEKRNEALRTAPAPERFPPTEVSFRIDATRWRLHLAGGRGRPSLRQSPSGVLQVTGATDGAATRALLRGWLMSRARAVLEPRLASIALEFSIRYHSLSVRQQRTRWGSCSSRGAINLNASLVFQRPEVVRYLMIHELTHVEHLNHSPRFWHAVESRCADWRTLDRELLEGWRRVPSWVYAE